MNLPHIHLLSTRRQRPPFAAIPEEIPLHRVRPWNPTSAVRTHASSSLGQQFVRAIGPIKKFIDDFFLTIATVASCAFLIWSVQQVRYAYWPAGFGVTMFASIVLASLFVTYFTVSMLGVLAGRRLFR